ncbi:MAG TPA: hypothetical protein DCQ94_00905 [Nitrospira sp.]|nr:hypothetical protein [Nitrospira sp.]
MAKTKQSDGTNADTSLFVRGVPREMLAKLKAMAALNQQSLGEYVTGLFARHLEDLEKRGLLPKGK